MRRLVQSLAAAMGLCALLIGARGAPDAALAQAPGSHAVLMPFVTRNYRPGAHLGYGANVASAANTGYLRQMGFDWGKGFFTLDYLLPPAAQSYGDLDNQLGAYTAAGISRVLVRLDADAPPLAPSELDAFRAGARALAAHVAATWRPRGLDTVAYEIWNEPNLDYEWRGGVPNPAAYTALLIAAYRGIKAADPAAIVVTGGLATTGDGQGMSLRAGAVAMGDLHFIRGMYQAGASGYFDALGSHPYGGLAAPEEKVGVTYFRRAEEQRQVMLEFGDAGTPVWATEFGWPVAGECHLGEHEPFRVGEAQQADYLVRAYRYADANWPWMGPMFLFNLDFGAVDWYERCDPIRWYSLLYRTDPTAMPPPPIVARPAFQALREMDKYPRRW